MLIFKKGDLIEPVQDNTINSPDIIEDLLGQLSLICLKDVEGEIDQIVEFESQKTGRRLELGAWRFQLVPRLVPDIKEIIESFTNGL